MPTEETVEIVYMKKSEAVGVNSVGFLEQVPKIKGPELVKYCLLLNLFFWWKCLGFMLTLVYCMYCNSVYFKNWSLNKILIWRMLDWDKT